MMLKREGGNESSESGEEGEEEDEGVHGFGGGVVCVHREGISVQITGE